MCVSLCVASYSFSSSIRREGYVVASIALSSIVVALINFKEGRMEGVYNNKLETAKKAQNMGLTLEVITELTGLSKEEILKLMQN